MKGIMQSLNLNLDIFNPKLITNYGMTAKRAKKLIQAGHVEWICSQYDVIIIGDTVPHGRALLQSMVERSPARRCRSKLVVEMTNRFDWDIKDRNAYYGLVRRLIKERSQDVFWVANNNLEKPYVEFFTQTKMKDVRLLRPIGISGDFPYPSDLPPPSNETFASRTHDTTNIFHILRDIHKIPLTIFPFGHKYGGPQNLLAFKGFIDVPYQYSVMKFYENIAYGVPQFIPTPRLFESLLAANLHFTHCIYPRLVKEFPAPGTKDADEAVMLVPGFPAWSAYMDYYDPLFAPYVYYFDNVQELQSVAEKRTGAEVDWKKVRERGPLFYGQYRGQILEGWALLFRDMGFDGVKVVGLSN
ncbi:hypothetical protein HDU79_008204 [Rhizoclosmatium sp. JEL0117]|nr:hypothetical protein HDU79_008204 [Rhizoclosmatium sp. JEL0117]